MEQDTPRQSDSWQVSKVSSDKLYVIEGNSGAWDDYRTFIVGIYETSAMAEEEKRKYLTKITEWKNRYTPEENEKYDEETDEDTSLWSKEAHNWWKWYYGPHMNYNLSATITEIPLNIMRWEEH